ncbi:hypothetical protein Tola_0829 [Tolumonas auensis DSM 9187]|uniref:Lipoprotein n=1 Tax=Tolumonas auensis (strain DSM 9187 / NBRC 110442 / TA 4) TaxID=595494 RepID=C4LBX8_TOLAT|nr:hypothetical protein [Tolumonas auensis]ACQ92457.1 hypothetical protein Tola_0829 [Tolumonas auensis DSM 9187]
MIHAAWYVSFVLSVLLFLSTGCDAGHKPPPAEKPSTQDTILKDQLKPLDDAKKVEQTLQQAADKQAEEIRQQTK